MNPNLVIVFALVSIIIRNFSHAEFTEVVQTKNGPVRGEILKTILNGVKYSSFRGIPYAQPPVGKNRFQPPQKPNSWTEVLDAINDPNPCPQVDFSSLSVVGDEDCLYLNVYTPQAQLNSLTELKTVMVWIYGGAYVTGFNNSTFYGPDFLIEKDVVVVSMNYRLGALGFLTLGNEEISGNAGLKDQALAIRWVNENIEDFGGDPNKVTIFGQSAGSASVEFHHLSPASQGLFRASIAMSGSPLNPWAINDLGKAVNMSIERIQSQIMSSFDLNSTEDISKLYDVPFDEFALLDDFSSFREDFTITFAPTVEVEGTQNQPFITRKPFLLYQSGDFYHVPHILGYMANESVSFLGLLLPSYLESNETALNQFTTDGFRIGINLTRRFMIESSPVPIFYYRNVFEYPELLHKVNGVNVDGSGHSDDVPYVFYMQGKDQPLDPNDEVSIFRDKFLTLWTNFAKYLDPSAIFEDGTEIRWPQTDNAGRLLLLNSTFEVVESEY